MMHTWKKWLGAAAVLLLAGAGCGQPVQPVALITTPAEVAQPAVQPEAKTGTKAVSAVTVDEVTDAAIQGSDEDATSTLQENSDAGLVNNDSSELNDYGQAYVDTDFR
jgi:hypothetical protein